MLTAPASSSSMASSSSAAISSAVAARMRKSGKQRAILLSRASDAARATQISDRQLGVLRSLARHDGWVQPMDIGGRDGSHDSATLAQLARRGLVERKKLHAIYCYNGSTQRQKLVDNHWVVTDGHLPSTACCCKGSCRYRITRQGSKAAN